MLLSGHLLLNVGGATREALAWSSYNFPRLGTQNLQLHLNSRLPSILAADFMQRLLVLDPSTNFIRSADLPELVHQEY